MTQKLSEIAVWIRGARAIVGGFAVGIPIAVITMGKYLLCPECGAPDPNMESMEILDNLLYFLTVLAALLTFFTTVFVLANWMYDKVLYCILRFHLRNKYSISDVLAEYKTSLGTEEDLSDYGKQLAKEMEKISWINSLDRKLKENRIKTIRKAFS